MEKTKEEDKEMHPGPQDGDPGNEPDEGAEVDQPEEKKQEPDPLAYLKDEVRRLSGELQTLRATNRPPEDAGKKKEAEPEPEWDKILFEQPKEAVALLRKQIKEEITSEMQGRYTTDQNQRQFWNGFFEQNPDLRQDRDLVEVTMHANLAELGNMKVEEAATRLAELTRERILRYSGDKQNGGKKKPQAEGANPPRPKNKTPEEKKPATLAEIIKARRAKHSAPSPGNRGSAA